MSINVSTAMDTIGTALAGITTLNVLDYIPDSVTPPAAVVGYPEELEYDNTMKRGTDRATFTVTVVVGQAHDQSTRDLLSGYMRGDGSTSTSVKVALDAIGSAVRVMRARTVPMLYAGQQMVGAVFDVDYVA